MRMLVLGAGLQGSACAYDLLQNPDVKEVRLADLKVDHLASWWHTDADLGRTVETFTDMGRSRRLGFAGVRDTESSFTDLFARLRAERIVP